VPKRGRSVLTFFAFINMLNFSVNACFRIGEEVYTRATRFKICQKVDFPQKHFLNQKQNKKKEILA
jgi:hypothetical protein